MHITMYSVSHQVSSCQKWRPKRSLLGPLLFPILIFDINNEITDSIVSCFNDDTRILPGIKDEEDTQLLQNDLHELYIFADTNNMNYNANKFEYGKDMEKNRKEQFRTGIIFGGPVIALGLTLKSLSHCQVRTNETYSIGGQASVL